VSLIQDIRSTPRAGLLAGITAAAVGIIYGYDSSNIGGALLFLKDEFRLDEAGLGLVTTTVVIGEVVGALLGGVLANKLGRKVSMVLVAAGYALFALLSGLTPNLEVLVAARLFLGLTVGVSIVVVPVFVAESSPAKIRGAMLVAYQVATVFGIILGYLVAWALSDAGAWRWMLGLAAIPSLLVFFLVLRIPDTSRWYVMKGRIAEARATLANIEPDADIDREIADMQAALSEEKGGALKEMLRKPYLRATIFVVILGFFIQITGINAIVYYSPILFKSMGFEGNAAILGLPALVQAVALVAVFISLSLVDRVGRRPILLGGIAMMIAANILLVCVFIAGGNTFGGILTALGFIGVLLFTVGFTFGFGALVWVYAGESFPARLRSLGSSVMLTSDLVANVIVGFLFLPMLSGLGGVGTFLVFGLLALAAFGFVYKFAPETKGKNLEDIRIFWENGGRWEAKR